MKAVTQDRHNKSHKRLVHIVRLYLSSIYGLVLQRFSTVSQLASWTPLGKAASSHTERKKNSYLEKNKSLIKKYLFLTKTHVPRLFAFLKIILNK